MCSELLREYKLWLGEILEVLGLVCEDVVPAGRFDQELYWRTKSLQENLAGLGREGKRPAQISLLLQYQKDGRALLETVRAEADSIAAKNVIPGKDAGNSEVLPEEFQILFRRKYAGDILNSLQMLVNFNFLAEEYLNCPVGTIDKIFEIDTVDGMKRVRSGARVGGNAYATRAERGQEGYGKPYVWKGYVAG